MTTIDYDLVKRYIDSYITGYDLTRSEILLIQDFVDNVFMLAVSDDK